jgi:hypothetical protein
MLKEAFGVALKRYWGLVAAILLINAASDWRHNQNISASGMLVALLVALALFFFVAVPVELRKLEKSR